jgi:hypothetical protein
MSVLVAVIGLGVAIYAIPIFLNVIRAQKESGSQRKKLPWSSWWFIPSLIAAAALGLLLAKFAPASLGRLVIAALFIVLVVKARQLR